MGAVDEDFPIGARVYITVPFSRLRKTEGVVVGYSVRGGVRVKRPNVKAATAYGPKFLTLVDPLGQLRTEAARRLGRIGGLKGGKARAAKLSPERRSEISRAGALARWGNRPAATPKGGAK